MIISASRRTDIPAFYSEWFFNRISAGFCTVPNPIITKQVGYISLNPKDVDVVVFWTRNAKPIIKRLDELDRRGFRYYFQYTLLAYPRLLDKLSPSIQDAIETLRMLSDKIGSNKVIWRYDPIIISNKTPSNFHKEMFNTIAQALRGHTNRVMVSIIDIYNYITPRLQALEKRGLKIMAYDDVAIDSLISSLAKTAVENGMEIYTCAEEGDFRRYGVQPGKCVDDMLINKIFNISVSPKKDPNQRKACGCILSKDIGMYDSCRFGCIYCYASKRREQLGKRSENHDPASPSLLGWYEEDGIEGRQKSRSQLRLFE